jgi:hypothetical protein
MLILNPQVCSAIAVLNTLHQTMFCDRKNRFFLREAKRFRFIKIGSVKLKIKVQKTK